jgi:hypothetical protein
LDEINEDNPEIETFEIDLFLNRGLTKTPDAENMDPDAICEALNSFEDPDVVELLCKSVI